MALPTKKKHQTQPSNLEAKLEETPQTLISSSQDPKKKKLTLPPSPNLSPLTSVNHPSNLDHWLVQWHKSRPQQPSPTAWWPKPWELEYPNKETPPALRESSEPFSPHNTIEEMEVEMILLNLTDEILESAKKEGREVVEVEMTPTQGVEEAAEEVNLIWQAVEMQPTQGHYRTR